MHEGIWNNAPHITAFQDSGCCINGLHSHMRCAAIGPKKSVSSACHKVNATKLRQGNKERKYCSLLVKQCCFQEAHRNIYYANYYFRTKACYFFPPPWLSSPWRTLAASYIGFLIYLDIWWDSLDEWSARRRASTYTGQHNTTQKDADKHPCLERDSNPRSQ
jgi:hypothetical protein